MRAFPCVLAALFVVAAAPAGAQSPPLPGDDNSILYQDAGGYDCQIRPEYCGGGGGAGNGGACTGPCQKCYFNIPWAWICGDADNEGGSCQCQA
jgi:hypothetical protein